MSIAGSFPISRVLHRYWCLIFLKTVRKTYTTEQWGTASVRVTQKGTNEFPILRLPDPVRPFSVDTDASNVQIGAALFQEFNDDGVRHPIGFWCNNLNAEERNYSATERECLGVIWAVQILRPYLEFKKFKLFTDHSPLKWLMNIVNPGIRLSRWCLILSEFDFKVNYRKGSHNHVADAVPRLPTDGYETPGPDLEIPTFLIEDDAIPIKHSVRSTVDTSCWRNEDWDPFET